MTNGVISALTAIIVGGWPTSIFSRISTPAAQVHSLALFVLTITGGIFLGMSALLAYAVITYRARPDDLTEPAQVFGSTQIELAWTIIPILIIVVLFLGTARVIFAIQDAPKPQSAVNVIAIGHQFWWEFRYPDLGIVTANELHVPVSDLRAPTPTYLKLTSADVIHSFWVPRLAGKTDLLPDRVNEMWIDPHVAGLDLGQCAQFCGPQHAKMLLRVYVDTPAQFRQWVANQQKTQQSGTSSVTSQPTQPNAGNLVPTSYHPGGQAAEAGNSVIPVGPGANGVPPNSPATRGEIAQGATSASGAITKQEGRRVFEEQACVNCHNISGTVANGRYGPDLTHFGSRATLASGIAANTPQNLLTWITDPSDLKPGALMPAMHLTDVQNKQLVAYLQSLR